MNVESDKTIMEKRRICHVTSVHPPFDTRIFHKECKSLQKKYEVVLVVANAKDEVRDGIKIVGVHLPTNRFSRIIKVGSIITKLKEIDAEVYHFHDPELLRVGVKLKKQINRTIIFDSHEDIPMQILCKEYLPSWLKKTLSRCYMVYEKRMMKKYDALITVTPSISERLSKINSKTIQITNYPNIQEIHGVNIWNKSVCFTGGISEQYQHHLIINCLDKVNATYTMAGPVFFDTYLQSLKQSPNWDKVDYRGYVSYDECLKIMKESSAGLAILFYSPNVGYKRGTLGVLKIFEYMMAGIPVIATDFELWKDIIEGNECGICVNPYDEDAIVRAINFVIENPKEAKKMGANGQKAVREKYNWGTQEPILYDLYSKMLEQR